MKRTTLAKWIIPALALLASAGASAQTDPPAPSPASEVTLRDGTVLTNCNAEMVCVDEQRGLVVVDEAVLRGDRRGAVELIWDGDGAVLRDRLARVARRNTPNDPQLAHELAEERYVEIEEEALKLALGGETRAYVRVTTGEKIPNRAAPFIAQLRYGSRVTTAMVPDLANSRTFGVDWQARHRCGGTLIAREWVLTAAHCVDPDQVKTGLSVQLGVTDISKPQGHEVEVDGAVVHAGYGRDTCPDPRVVCRDIQHDDIALLHLRVDPAKPIPRSITPAEILRKVPQEGLAVSAAGWGRTSNAAPGTINASAHLARVNMSVLANKNCEKLPEYGSYMIRQTDGTEVERKRIHKNVICVRGGGMKTCSGDSGGPLYQQPKPGIGPLLVAIVSWNKKGCDITSSVNPGVYTLVLPYLDWIERAKQKAPRNKTVVKLN